MRICIIGASGMLGYQLYQYFAPRAQTGVVLRWPKNYYPCADKFSQAASCYDGINVLDYRSLDQIFAHFKPNAIINAVGIVKQLALSKQAIPALEINALLPHKISELAAKHAARLFHISTDCVFSGKQGPYTEDSLPDAEDIYGRSKLMGEVYDPHAITIRSSIIGLEMMRKTSLVEWFLAQTGNIKGFTKALYTGMTTLEMARLIEYLINQQPDLHGLWHVTSETINKYDLLSQLSAVLGRTDINITADDNFHCDRRLDGSRFASLTGYKLPSWPQMLAELAEQIKQNAAMAA